MSDLWRGINGDWPIGYALYFREQHMKAKETRNRMINSGWKFVCIEPNLKPIDEWKKEIENGKEQD